MASNTITGTQVLGTALQNLLMADEIVPGAKPSYELAKSIYLYHPIGAKIIDFPLQMAQFKPREIKVPKAPDDGKMLVEAFDDEWRAVQADLRILNTARQARIYGIATLGLLVDGADTKESVDYKDLARVSVSFNVWDPLNTAGSLVLNQDPNAMDYQKVQGINVNGKPYHRSRFCVLMNEQPIYIAYENAGFGFVGRSVYQRGLTPLKSFIRTLATDDMIALKAGVLVAKMKSPSSAVDGPMSWLLGSKRQMVKEAQTGNVLSMDVDEEVESLNLQNIDGAYGMARTNIIENIASACGTPAKILLAETFAEGFGEGDNDAKAVAQYIEGVRTWMQPLYSFMDTIVMYRAWNEEFYATVQSRYPDQYGDVSYSAAFQEWKNSFFAEWPSLLDEPESEKQKGEKVALDAIIETAVLLMPALDPANKARLIEWVSDSLNQRKRLFPAPLELDIEELANYEPPVQTSEFGAPRAEDLRDSAPRRRRERIDAVDETLKRAALSNLRLIETDRAR